MKWKIVYRHGFKQASWDLYPNNKYSDKVSKLPFAPTHRTFDTLAAAQHYKHGVASCRLPFPCPVWIAKLFFSYYEPADWRA
jgi:hypothetical protein